LLLWLQHMAESIFGVAEETPTERQGKLEYRA